MITDVPTERPVKFPVVPIVATDVLLLVHVPPEVVLLNTDDDEAGRQSEVFPVIGVNAGMSFTVTSVVAMPWHKPLV